jgi:thiamine biosynthesis protein ThiS
MNVRLNGEDRQLPAEMTLEGLVEHLELKGKPIAIELNREVIPRPRFSEVKVREGDRIEVVTFVGGG